MKTFRLAISAVITTLLLPIVTLNTWLFALTSAVILFVGFCINQPLLYLMGLVRGQK